MKLCADKLNITNKTQAHLSGSFNDSNILHAFSKSSGDKSFGKRKKGNFSIWQGNKDYNLREAWICAPMRASPPFLWHDWRGSTPQWEPSYRHAPEKAGNSRMSETNRFSKRIKMETKVRFNWVYDLSLCRCKTCDTPTSRGACSMSPSCLASCKW